jgi:hypothetical protein
VTIQAEWNSSETSYISSPTKGNANPQDTSMRLVVLPRGRLGYWSFEDRLWAGDEGQLPAVNEHLSAATPGLWFDSPSADDPNPVDLEYPAFQSDGQPPVYEFGPNPGQIIDYTYASSGTPNIRRNRGTICFWFLPNWTSGNQFTSVGDNGPNGGVFLDMLGGGWVLKLTSIGSNIELDAPQGIEINSWPINWAKGYLHHVAVTYTEVRTILYVDGLQVGVAGPGVPPITSTFSGNFRIGSDGGSNPINGALGRLETFNYELGASEVFADYTSSTNSFDPCWLSPNCPQRTQPPYNPNDTTPPAIQLLEPINAIANP